MTESISTQYPLVQTEREYIFGLQSGKCAICVARLATDLDHNHKTGAVRGGLCHGCNVLIGRKCERIELLKAALAATKDPVMAFRYRRAIAYLEVFGADPRETPWEKKAREATQQEAVAA